MCSNDENILYADDTLLEYVGTSLERFTEHINSRLHEICKWCNCNDLSLKQSKSDFTTVTNKIVVNRPQLFIDTDLIKGVDSFKSLGIHADTLLKFNIQTNK